MDKLVLEDDGYFETWERPCGHRYRVETQYLPRVNYSVRNPKVRPEALADERKRAAARPCRQCEVTA